MNQDDSGRDSDRGISDTSTTAVIKFGDSSSGDANDSETRYGIGAVITILVQYLVLLSLEQRQLHMSHIISVEGPGSESPR